MAAPRLSPDHVLSPRERSIRWRQRRKGLLPPVPPRPPRPPQPEWMRQLRTFDEMLADLERGKEP
jgi:hypothetical protein